MVLHEHDMVSLHTFINITIFREIHPPGEQTFSQFGPFMWPFGHGKAHGIQDQTRCQGRGDPSRVIGRTDFDQVQSHQLRARNQLPQQVLDFCFELHVTAGHCGSYVIKLGHEVKWHSKSPNSTLLAHWLPTWGKSRGPWGGLSSSLIVQFHPKKSQKETTLGWSKTEPLSAITCHHSLYIFIQHIFIRVPGDPMKTAAMFGFKKPLIIKDKCARCQSE